MTWLLSLITSVPDLIKGWFGYQSKKLDVAVNSSDNAKDVSVAVVQSETSRQNNVTSVILAGMNHPIWWVAWSLGVLPVMLYYAAIFWVSTFPFWGWTVHKAPDDALEFAKLVVGSMFGIAGTASVITGVVQAWRTKA